MGVKEMVQQKAYIAKDIKGKLVIILKNQNGENEDFDEKLPYIVYDENLKQIAEGSTDSYKIVLESLDVSKVGFISVKGKFYPVTRVPEGRVGQPTLYEYSWGLPIVSKSKSRFHVDLFDRGKINGKHVGWLIVSMFLQCQFEGFKNVTEEKKKEIANQIKNSILHFWYKPNWKLIPRQTRVVPYVPPYDEIYVKFVIETAIEGWHWDDFEITIVEAVSKDKSRAYVNSGMGNMVIYYSKGDHIIVPDTSGSERCVVAHEFGHCLGLEDEYHESDQALDTDATLWRIWSCFIHGAPYKYDTKSMMLSNREVRLRHYWPFAQWVKEKSVKFADVPEEIPYAITDGNRTFFVEEDLWKPIEYETGVKGPGGFGNYRSFFFAIGDDDFQEALQRRYSRALRSNANIPIFDSLLVVRLNLQLYFANEKGDREGWTDDEKRNVMWRIVGQPVGTARTREIIDEFWNNRFYLTSSTGNYKRTAVLFDVRTLTDVESWPGRGDAERFNWSDDFEIEFRKNTDDSAIDYKGGFLKGYNILLPAGCIDPKYTGLKFWHHFGHLLGLRDEGGIWGAGCIKDGKKYFNEYRDDKDSVMNYGENVRWRHYWPFAQWLNKTLADYNERYVVNDGSQEYHL